MAFNKDIPTAGTSLRASNPQILANQAQVQIALDNEHAFTGTDATTQTGDHTQGSARCFIQDDAPATRIDGDNFLSTDLGSLWIDTNSTPVNQFNILTTTTPTWTPVSDEIIATLLAANRVFAGDLGVDGDFTMLTGKIATIELIQAVDVTGVHIRDDSGTVNIDFADGGKVDSANSACISTDTGLTEDDDDLLASQKAIKAYIDAQISIITSNSLINLGGQSNLNIVSGTVTITQSYHSIDTQGDIPSDDLDTINGGSTGDILVLRASSSSRTVVVRDNGNINLAGGVNFAMDNVADTIMFIFFLSEWKEISRSGNG